jgi:purine nucleosidase
MGGALRVPGNVYVPDLPSGTAPVDGTAEWNAFWDPSALGVVWGSSVPLVITPLDATNQVEV